MTIEEILKRLKEIVKELENEDLAADDVDKLDKEAEDLRSKKVELEKNAEARKAALQRAANFGVVVEDYQGNNNNQNQRQYGVDSAEYRSGYLNCLLGRELNDVEQRATEFVHTTVNTPNPIPVTMLNEIWDLVSQEHSILGDITIYRTGTVIEINKHTAVTKGRAKKVDENTANDDEQNTFVKVTLSGKDYSKSIEISYKMANMSIDAFEKYLVNEISTQLGEVLAEDVINQIKNDMSADNVVTTSSTTDVAYKEVTTLFSKLKRAKNPIVYVNNVTLYAQLCSMVDTTGRPIYQVTVQEGAKGALLGATVKVDEALADGEILVGDSKKFILNMVQDIMVEDDKDIKKHKYIYAGYACAEGTLIDDKSFALLKLKKVA